MMDERIIECAKELIRVSGCDETVYAECKATVDDIEKDIREYQKLEGWNCEFDIRKVAEAILFVQEENLRNKPKEVPKRYIVVFSTDSICDSIGGYDNLDDALDEVEDFCIQHADETADWLYGDEGKPIEVKLEDWNYMIYNTECYVKEMNPERDGMEFPYDDGNEYYLDDERLERIGWKEYESLEDFEVFLYGKE